MEGKLSIGITKIIKMDCKQISKIKMSNRENTKKLQLVNEVIVMDIQWKMFEY